MRTLTARLRTWRRNRFYAAVNRERARQVRLGYTAEHDDKHGIDHLLMWAQEYLVSGKRIATAALIDAAREAFQRETVRREPPLEQKCAHPNFEGDGECYRGCCDRFKCLDADCGETWSVAR